MPRTKLEERSAVFPRYHGRVFCVRVYQDTRTGRFMWTATDESARRVVVSRMTYSKKATAQLAAHSCAVDLSKTYKNGAAR